MKKDTASNRHIGRMVTKNLIILLTLVVVCFVGAWSWFTTNPTATASGLSVQAKAPAGVEIALVKNGDTPLDSDFKTTFSGSDAIDLVSLMNADFQLLDITGDGVTFRVPPLSQLNGIATPNLESTDWRNAVAGTDYISFDLYMRSKSKINLKLGSKSKVSAVSTVISGDSAGNKSAYGNFSRDAIVGATRLSVVHESASVTGGELRLLWIPRPDLYLDTSDGGYSLLTDKTLFPDAYVQTVTTTVDGKETKTNKLLTGSEIPADLTDAEKNKIVKITEVHQYWNSDYVKAEPVTVHTGGNLVVSSADAKTGEYTLGSGSYKIAELKDNQTAFKITQDGTAVGETYYYDKVTVNMWIEGEDSESRLALAGGQFKLFINLEEYIEKSA